MAINGSFHHYYYQEFGLYCEWSGTQNQIENYTDILLKVYVSYRSLDCQAKTGTIVINGCSPISYTSPRIYDMSGGSHKKLLVATTTVRVPHNSNGTKTGVDMSVVWNCYLTYQGTYYSSISASDTVTLDTIDRNAPTITHNITNITANGFKINATSSVTADIWEYSIDGGSTYTQFSTDEGTSASLTLTGFSPNTSYSVAVKARKKSNHVYGFSTASTVRTLGGSEITSVQSAYIDVAMPQIRYSVTVYDGAYYHKLTVKNGNTTIFSDNLGQFTAGVSNKTYDISISQRLQMLNQIPNATYFFATVELTSYSDSGYTQQVGDASSKLAMMCTSEETSRPTFTTFTYKDNRQRTVDATQDDQVLIQTYSKLLVTATAGQAKNGASISAYSVSIGEVSKQFSTTSMDVGSVNTAGTIALTVSCIDSRGYSTSVTQNVKVLEYTKPRLSSLSVKRRNEVESTVMLSLSGSFKEIMADGETDTNSLKYAGFYYKKTNSSTWSSYISFKNAVTVTGTSFSLNNYQVIESGSTLLDLDPDYSWDFKVLIRDQLDELSSYDVIVVIPQGMPIVSLRKRDLNYDFPRVGINQQQPTAALDVNGNIKMNGYNVLGYISTLDDSTDLNNITEPGVYAQPQNSNATANHNYPDTKAGMLEVFAEPSGHVMQRYTVYDMSGLYLRYRSLGNWSSWKAATLT